MRTQIVFGLLLISSTLYANAPFSTIGKISLRGLPPVESYQESKTFRSARADRVYDALLKIPVGAPPIWHGGDQNALFIGAVLSRMIRRVDLESVSQGILNPSFQPWLTGTDFALVGSLCQRKGDYDFTLQFLLKVAYLDRQAGKTLLSEEARQKLYSVLLSESGVEHHERVSIGGCLTVLDTENHILGTEVSRYLTNQILFRECQIKGKSCPQYNNAQNGFDAWMLNHIADFLKNDFSEFNSKPYEGISLNALGNLYDFSDNLKVKTVAQMALDYSATKMAVSTNGLRRLAPFRRLKEVLNQDLLQVADTALWRSVFQVGNYEFIKYQNGGIDPEFYEEEYYFPLMAMLETYQIPDLILDLQIDKRTPYQQKIRHSDVEHYISSPNFLITAGGRWRDVADFNTGGNDAWAVATSVIPTKGEYRMKNLFYFLGDLDPEKRNNMCVAKNFACGINLHTPENIPESCKIRNGKWIFYNFKDCSLKYDFYVAAYIDKANSAWDDHNNNFGLLEVSEADIEFKQFMQSILQKNPSKNFRPNRSSQYFSSAGDQIEFYFYPTSLNSSPVFKINGVQQQTVFAKWPRAEGDVMNSSIPGRIQITNSNLKQSLLLDVTDPLNPKRELRGLKKR